MRKHRVGSYPTSAMLTVVCNAEAAVQKKTLSMKICLTKYPSLFLFIILNITTVFGQDVFEKNQIKDLV